MPAGQGKPYVPPNPYRQVASSPQTQEIFDPQLFEKH